MEITSKTDERIILFEIEKSLENTQKNLIILNHLIGIMKEKLKLLMKGGK